MKVAILTANLLCICVLASPQDISTIKQANPIAVKGSLSLRSVLFNSSRPNPYRKPFSWYINGNPVLILYGNPVPLTITIGEQQRSFRQPFNRIGLSPYYKWVKVHLGYRNLNFSSFGLAGHTVLGAGVELTPGKFYFGYMHGRFNKAVKNDTTFSPTTFQTPAYARYGTAVKLGFGSSKNNAAVTFLRAGDHVTNQGPDPVKSTQNGKLYFYYLTTYSKDGQESEPGEEQSYRK